MADLSELSDDQLRKLRLQSMTDEELLAAERVAKQPNPFRDNQVADAALAIGSQLAMQPVAGWKGIWDALGDVPDRGEAGAAGVEGLMSHAYQPRTEGGAAIANAVTWVPRQIGEGIDWAGRGITTNLNKITGNPEGSALVGTGANVGLNYLTYMIGRLGGKMPYAPRVAPKAPAMIALDELTQERLNRAKTVPVPVPMTRGQALRNPEMLRQEELLAQTKQGEAIRDLHIEQNRAIIENLNTLRERAGPKSATPEDVGRRVAGERQLKGPEGALTMKERISGENVDAAYNRVRASPEINDPVDAADLIKWVAENDSAGASVPAIRSIASELKRRGAMEVDESTGLPVATRPLTIGEMEDVRKLANKLSKPGDPSAHYMWEVKRVIDRSTEKAGGDLYKSARRARVAHAMEFEEPRAIAQLLDSRSRTDRRVALEDVWQKTMIGGSIADLERVRTTLLDAPDRRVKDAGRKAWRDIAGNTLDYITQEATKSVALDASGNVVVSPAALKRALDRIGDKKLDITLGKSSADKLRQVAGVAYDVKTMPPNKAGSTTVSNFMAMMDGIGKHAGKIPFIGSTARGTLNVIRDVTESGARLKMTEEALNFPPVAKSAPPSRRLRLSDIAVMGDKASQGLMAVPAIGMRPPLEEQQQ